MFKTREEYLNMRKNLMDEAETLLNEGKGDEAEAKMNEVKELDNAFETWKVQMANLAALKDKADIATGVPTDSSKVNFENAVEQVCDFESEAYKNAWLHAVKGNRLNMEEQRILDNVNKHNMETAEKHTLIIPNSVRKGILQVAEESHPVLSDMEITDIQGTVTILYDTSNAGDAEWLDEDTESTDSEYTEGSIDLTGCELVKSVSISWKLKKMNDQEYEAYLIARLGEKVGNAIAKAVFEGKGKPGQDDTFKAQALGICTALSAQENTPRIVRFADKAEYKTITALMALLNAAYMAGASIYAKNAFVWNELANIVDLAGRPLFIPDPTGAGVGKLFGVTVKVEDGAPDDAAVLANVKKGYAFNFNERMTIYQEDKVRARKTEYSAYAIADGAPTLLEAFAMLLKDETVDEPSVNEPSVDEPSVDEGEGEGSGE